MLPGSVDCYVCANCYIRPECYILSFCSFCIECIECYIIYLDIYTVGWHTRFWGLLGQFGRATPSAPEPASDAGAWRPEPIAEGVMKRRICHTAPSATLEGERCEAPTASKERILRLRSLRLHSRFDSRSASLSKSKGGKVAKSNRQGDMVRCCVIPCSGDRVLINPAARGRSAAAVLGRL